MQILWLTDIYIFIYHFSLSLSQLLSISVNVSALKVRSISADALRLAIRLSGSSEEKPGILARVHITDAPLASVEGPLKEEGGRLLKSITSSGLHEFHPFSNVGY